MADNIWMIKFFDDLYFLIYVFLKEGLFLDEGFADDFDCIGFGIIFCITGCLLYNAKTT